MKSAIHTVCLIFSGVLMLFLHNAFSENLLKNTGFEEGLKYWNNWGGALSKEAHTGKSCVVVTNTEFKWSGLDQIIPLPANARSCEISGWMKTVDVVQGKEEWEQAQITLEFVDETGEMVGDYPPKVGEAIGTTEWTEYSNMLSVAFGARGIKLIVALGNATGTAYFDDLAVTAKDNEGKVITKKTLAAMSKVEKEKLDKAENQLFNGGFELGADGWETMEKNITTEAVHSGKKSLKIESREFNWIGITQQIPVPENAHKITCAGWIKADGVVQGKDGWCKANLTVEFRDNGGGMIGDYPPVVGEVVGTTDWLYYSRSYRIRPGTKKVAITCGLDEAKGRVYFDDIKAVIFDKKGKELKAVEVTGPTDEGEWYPLDVKNTASGSHYVDWSSLLDAPAGKHGFLTVKGEQFVFEDGTPVKFLGVVLCGPNAIVDKQKADSLTARLAKMGCNMLRLHHLDAEWAEPNIFGNAKGTRKLSPEVMKKIDYLIYSCKKRGIYMFLDILVNRQFYPEDGVEHAPPVLGAKQVGFYSKKLIELQKEYAKQFLSHKNEYTGLAYKDDPAIALSEFINETTIFTGFGGDLVPEGPYREELEALWNKSKFKGKTLASFELEWDSDPRGIIKNKKAGADVAGSIEFLMGLEEQYFLDMHKYFRSFGVKYPLAGSNMPLPILAMIKSSNAVDFVANDAYWDHPQLWKIQAGWDMVKYAPINNLSQLLASQNNSIRAVSYYRVTGKPYFIWGNHSYPSEYQLEHMPLLTCYASLQGWNGIFQHEFDHTPLGADSLESFGVARQPEDIAMWVVTAPLFLRGDIKSAPGRVDERITKKMILSDNSYSDFLKQNHFLPFVTRVAKTFDQDAQGSPDDFRKYYDEKNCVFRSETGELIYNGEKGVLEIRAPRVQGVVGFIKGQEFDFPLFSTKVGNTHAAVLAVSRDNKPLTESKHFYLAVVGPSKMTGQQFNHSRTALKRLGSLPVLQQVINGTVVFKNRTKKSKMQVLPLAPDGSAGKPMALAESEDELVLDLGKGRTFVYEVKLKKFK